MPDLVKYPARNRSLIRSYIDNIAIEIYNELIACIIYYSICSEV